MIDYEPSNECGVFYYFSKYHKLLGFEKIIKLTTQFPDVTAIRDAKKVRIELEYKLSSFRNHYKVIDHGFWAHKFKWNEEKQLWWLYNQVDNKWADHCNYTIEDKEKYTVDVGGNLSYKTLKDQCDCVICWITDTKIEDNLEVINLREALEKLQ